ncbi:MAG: tRNA pseudouridine(38-40) synthase TruA [Thermodesulfobacteriota bacterium]|nr:tRNA pseudouridine(38-40) synthase TruA [Thermodesulfobacteriota bacterium]
MNIRIDIEYIGTNFFGWQKQKRLRTIQGEIEKSVKKIFGEKIIVYGSGRTDSGVNDINQVANFHVKDEKKINMIGLKNKLNSILDSDIKIKSCNKVDENFHAQYDCKEKVYLYRIKINEPCSVFEKGRMWYLKKSINTKKLEKISSVFVGEIDFINFCKTGYSGENTVRNLRKISIKEKKNYIDFFITGNGFLRGMVRLIIGCLINFEKGVIQKKDVVLALKNKKRLKLNYSVPAEGLYLYKVKY